MCFKLVFAVRSVCVWSRRDERQRLGTELGVRVERSRLAARTVRVENKFQGEFIHQEKGKYFIVS